MPRVHRALWRLGWPIRMLLIGLIRVYRLVLSPFLGGSCRFHPTCSVYAERAIRQAGALRGTALATWRIARCSPLSSGGVDHPPTESDRLFLYDVLARRRVERSNDVVIRSGAAS